MIVIKSKMHVARLSGKEIFDFLIDPTDRDYQEWWKGTHLQLHSVKRVANDVGSVIYMDEFVGPRRVKMKGVVTEARPGKKLTWQVKRVIALPVWFSLELEDDDEGVNITHTIRAGFNGAGRVLDPALRLYFSDRFAKAMDEHVKTEFPKLRDLLRGRVPHSTS